MQFAQRTEPGTAGLHEAPRQVTIELGCSGAVLLDVWYPAHAEFDTHEHGAAYLALVVRGSYVEWNPARGSTAAGDVIEYAAGSRHAVRTGDESVRMLHVAIPDGAFPERPLRPGLLWQMARETADSSDAARLILESLTLEVLRPASGAVSPTGHPTWLERVKQHLRQGYREVIPLQALAATADLHPSHLAREFRRHTGMTAGTYLRRIRVAAAAHRLRNSDLSLARIAFETGFSDQSHMGRLFRRHVGMSPASFRRTVEVRRTGTGLVPGARSRG